MEATAEFYEQINPVLQKTIQKFCHRYGGDAEELLGESWVYIVQRLPYHDPQRCKNIVQWIIWEVWGTILNIRRKELKRQHKPLPKFKFCARSHTKDVKELIQEFKGDAQTVIQLLLLPPYEVISYYTEPHPTPTKMKTSVKKYLYNNCRWTGRRIAKTFAEIREILNDQ